MKEWLAVFPTLLFLLPSGASAADDPGGAARELARKTVAFAGRGESVTASWRNLSSLPPGDLAQARAVFESALRESGARAAEGGTVEIRITVSESRQQYLLVGEARKGDDRQTLIAAWKRPAGNAASAPAGVALERRLLWEQPDPILDAVLMPDALLILSPGKLTLYAHRESSFEQRASAPVTPARPWPRDARARLAVNGAAVRAFLPGTLCTGTLQPALTLECHAGDDPWPADAGAPPLLAAFVPGRNFFDGHVVMPTGARKSLAPFFTAGAISERGANYWVLALTSGTTQLLDANFETAGGITGWGSDLAATGAHCGGGSQILATKAGDAREPDSIRAYGLSNRVPVALTAPVDFSGPVTALWSAGGASAIAVVRDLETARYAVYLLTVVCSG
ncbi:MAG: hypothetical protein JST11_23100 [Acidobacteria bacterium]|nr:hypothetical protein [Acidobacteriota bacterium]